MASNAPSCPQDEQHTKHNVIRMHFIIHSATASANNSAKALSQDRGFGTGGNFSMLNVTSASKGYVLNLRRVNCKRFNVI